MTREEKAVKEKLFVEMKVKSKSRKDIIAELQISERTYSRWDSELACFIYHREKEYWAELMYLYGSPTVQ